MRTTFKLMTVLSLVISISACSNDDEQKTDATRPVKTVLLGDSQSSLERYFPGKVLPSKRADLSFEVAGKLTKFPIDKGELVKKGRLLAQLDQIPFTDAVQQKQARYDLNKAQYSRGKELIKGNYISKSEYDKLKSNYQISEANLSTAKRNLKDSTLHAPFDGIVADTYVENHEQVKAKQVMMSLHDIDKLDIETHVPEKFMLKLKESEKEKQDKNGASAVVKFDAYPNKQFPLSFKEFASQSDQDTQTYAVTFTMPQPKGLNVLPGMSVTVYVKISNKRFDYSSYYDLPVGAVFSGSNQQSYVWLVNKDMTIKKQPVTTGTLRRSSIEITKGLKPGDRVVIAGVNFIRDGQKVKLLKDTPIE
ncbi:MAG: efflux RND transporter periplasmic adaptor subunit [Coxiellaceae bacterium]|nr:efflux RND transporter periplasmic adaptor subunit [Coxiellaceae bacterium]